MANILPPSVRPLQPLTGQVITADRLAMAKAAADAERARIHTEGKKEGLRIAGIYRDVALVAIGLVPGLMLGALVALAAADRGAVTAAAVADQVLGRTIEPAPLSAPQELSVRDPGLEYRRNASEARGGCTEDEMRAGRRECREER